MATSRSMLGAVTLVGILLSSCMSWTPGWERPIAPAGDGEAGAALARATAELDRATDAAALDRARLALGEALALDPGRYETLVRLSEAEILRGAGYSDTKREKTEAYRAGIQYAERALATNSRFRARVVAGAGVDEAAVELGAAEAEAMLLWVTGVSYYFKECLSGVGHLVNFRWMLKTHEVLARLAAVDRGFQHGAVPFSLGIYYIGLPPSAGGDLARASELLEEAVAASDGHLLSRWGRAKYLHAKVGDREAFRADLEWVLAQDPATAPSPERWNVYFQRNARELLARTDELFPSPRG